MKSEIKDLYRVRFGLFVFLLILGGLLFQSSCVTPGPAVSEKKLSDHAVFRSEDYIVCMLRPPCVMDS